MRDIHLTGNLYEYDGQNGCVYAPNGIAPAVIASGKCVAKVLVMARRVKETGNIVGRRGNWKSPYRGRVYSDSGVCPALNANSGGNLIPKITGGNPYRIRRITERETFRLMDVDEKDIDILLGAGISGSQLYKLAGNSIVVGCLCELFRKMFIEPGNDSEQLTIWQEI